GALGRETETVWLGERLAWTSFGVSAIIQRIYRLILIDEGFQQSHHSRPAAQGESIDSNLLGFSPPLGNEGAIMLIRPSGFGPQPPEDGWGLRAGVHAVVFATRQWEV